MTGLPISPNTDGPRDPAFGPDRTPYDALGGDEGVRALADAFYDRMESDGPTVRAMHPADLSETRQKFYEFLSGWLGGPQLYMARRGHPRLRMRHAPFPLDQGAADEWLACMRLALDDRGVTGPVRAFLDERFAHVANFLINR